MSSLPPRPGNPFAHPAVKNSPHAHSSPNFRRTFSAACALAASIGLACLPAEVDAQVDSTTNLGVYLERTEHQDGDGTQPITRNGNALVAAERALRHARACSLDSGSSATWSWAGHAGSGEGGRLRVALPRRWEGGLSIPLVDSSLLPQDTDWRSSFSRSYSSGPEPHG